MKFLLISLALFSSIFAQANSPEVVTSPIDHLFVPKGFDNNDNVEIVVTGKYPNPCYTRNNSVVEIRDNKVLITVTSLLRESGENCNPMSVPFTEAITVGNLQAGPYEIIVNGGTNYEQTESLNVEISNSTGVDEHIYAIVDYIELGFTGGISGIAFLMVRSPSDCVVFDRVEYLANGKDTLSVQPIMKKISDNCIEKVKRFEIPIKFDPQSFKHKDLLIFVRSIEGKSIHSIINK